MGNNCLEEVIEMIEEKLDNVQQQKLLQGLQVKIMDEENLVFSEKLENIPWNKIKRQLELLKRKDIVDEIGKKTLITKGIIEVKLYYTIIFWGGVMSVVFRRSSLLLIFPQTFPTYQSY